MDTKEIATTIKSSILKAERKNAPLCKMQPYEMVFNANSIENIAVKKKSKP